MVCDAPFYQPALTVPSGGAGPRALSVAAPNVLVMRPVREAPGGEGTAMYRQGDVLIVPVAQDAVPAHAAHAPRERRDGRGRLVLALGEVTGHAHAVVGPGSWCASRDLTVRCCSICPRAGGWCTRSTRRSRCPRGGSGSSDSGSTCPVRYGSWPTEEPGRTGGMRAPGTEWRRARGRDGRGSGRGDGPEAGRGAGSVTTIAEPGTEGARLDDGERRSGLPPTSRSGGRGPRRPAPRTGRAPRRASGGPTGWRDSRNRSGWSGRVHRARRSLSSGS